VTRTAWITITAATLALVAVGALILVLYGGDATTTPRETTDSTEETFSLPLTQDPSALALGKHAGNVLVGIAVRPGGPLEVAVLRAETPIATRELEVEVDGQPVEAQACGVGCSRVQAPLLEGSRRRLTVRAGSAAVRFALPARLPPSGTALFRKALTTMNALDAFRFTEDLSSGRGGLRSQFDVQAPDRLRLRTANGFRSVIIGQTRWDFLDGRWERSPYPGLRVTRLLMWHKTRFARVVGRRANGVTELAGFGLEPVPAWFRLSVEPSGRVLEAEMTAASHFMLHTYEYFNGRFVIAPPK
jgi:hypothetical protein